MILVNWIRFGIRKNPERLFGMSGGYYNQETGTTIVGESRSDLRVGMTTVHELIHKYVELHVGVTRGVHKVPDDDYRVQRIGLEVEKISKTGERVKIGGLLNELPNYYYGDQWMKKELQDNGGFRQKELSEQLEFLNKLGLEEKSWFNFPVSNSAGKRYLIRLSSANLFVGVNVLKSSNGNWEFTSDLIFTELASNLEHLVNKVEGVPLMQALLKAKIDPKKQEVIQKAVDNKFGEGFFKRLKGVRNSDPDGLLEILKEVQARIVNEDN